MNDIQSQVVFAKHNQTGRKLGRSDLPKKGNFARIIWASLDDLSTMITQGLIEQSNDPSKLVLTPNQLAYKIVSCNANNRPGAENTVCVMLENPNDLNMKGLPIVFEIKSAILRMVRDPSNENDNGHEESC